MSLPVSAEAGVGFIPEQSLFARSVLEAELGYSFADSELLTTALSHRSWCAEYGGFSNERLEFLGDAVLGLLVADFVYQRCPDHPEGDLAKIRSAVVNAQALAEVALSVSLGDALLLGRGEESTGGKTKESVLSDAMEAVLGAVYIDGGYQAAAEVVDRVFSKTIERAISIPGNQDYKTRLQELTVQQFGSSPSYRTTATGPEHQKRFDALVEIEGVLYGPASGTSKKRSEQAAARMAWQDLKRSDEVGLGGRI